MNGKTFTIKEALVLTTGILGRIELPVLMYDKVGIPIRKAIENINKCIEAIPDPKTDETEGQETMDESTEEETENE